MGDRTCPNGHPAVDGELFCGDCGASLRADTVGERLQVSVDPDGQRPAAAGPRRQALVAAGLVLVAAIGLVVVVATSGDSGDSAGSTANTSTASEVPAGAPFSTPLPRTDPTTTDRTSTNPRERTTTVAPGVDPTSGNVLDLGPTTSNSRIARTLQRMAGSVSSEDPIEWMGVDPIRIDGAALVYVEQVLGGDGSRSESSMWVFDDDDPDAVGSRLEAALSTFGDVSVSSDSDLLFEPFTVLLTVADLTAYAGAISDDTAVVWFQRLATGAALPDELPASLDDAHARAMIETAREVGVLEYFSLQSGIGPYSWSGSQFGNGYSATAISIVQPIAITDSQEWADTLCAAVGVGPAAAEPTFAPLRGPTTSDPATTPGGCGSTASWAFDQYDGTLHAFGYSSW